MSLKNCLRLAQNSRTLLTLTPKSSSVLPLAIVPQRLSSTIGPFFTDYHRKRKKEWQKPRKAKETEQKQESSRKTESSAAEAAPKLPPTHMLYTIPELLPTTYWGHRDSVREALERVDLAKRRGVLKVPEFYVGSIMSVTVADDMSPTKQTKFVGICIEKGEPGLRHRFTLRNIIDDQGVEIMYELYNPMIRDITVIKLEKRLDEEMVYLRDALPEYSTVPFDLKPIPRSANEAVPLNETRVKMKPRPWAQRWERKGFKGIDESTMLSQLTEEERAQRLEPNRNMMWEKYDLALQFRNSITREESDAIYEDIVGRFDRTRDMDALPEEERPIIARRKARKL